LPVLGLVLLGTAALLLWTKRDRLGATGEPGANPELATPAPRPKSSIPELTKALASSEASDRAAAAQDLGVAIAEAVQEGGPPADSQAAIAALVDAVEDRATEVSTTAGLALAVAFRARPKPGGESPLDPAPAVAALGRRLTSKDRATRSMALAALSGIARAVPAPAPPELLAALDEGSPQDRDHAAMTVAAFQQGVEPAIPVMFRAFEAAPPGSPGNMNAAFSAIRPPPASIPLLIEKLAHARADVRTRAAQLLGRIGPGAKEAIPALLDLLANSDPRGIEGLEVPQSYRGYSPSHDPAAEAAAQALPKIAGGTDAAPAALDELTKGLRERPPSHRRVYAYTLGLFGKAAAPAVPALVETLRAEVAEPSTPGTGQRLAWALGEIAPETPEASQAVTALSDALGATEAPTVTAAIQALGRFGPAAAPALPRLRELKADSQYEGPINRVLGRIEPAP
jgi:HEAT repeat protein